MHKLESQILSIFKLNPEKDFSTSEIVEKIFPEISISPDVPMSKEAIHLQKKSKAKNHRKLLYHINKLVDEGILKTSKVQAKGEKCFTIAIEEGEIIIGKGHKKIIISKTQTRITPIEGYEKQKIVQKIGGENWAGQLNCILLEGDQFTGLNNIYSIIVESFANLNDCIGINSFEKHLQNSQELESFLEKLDKDTRDYGKRACLLMGLEKSGPEIEEFCRIFADISPKRVDVIFSMDSKELSRKTKIIERIAEIFSEKTIKINIKNNSLKAAPIIIGSAGVYSFDDEEWKNYLKTQKGSLKGICCSQSSMVVDYEKFFKSSSSSAEFRKLVANCLKSLVIANTMQRRKAFEYFRHIEGLSKDNPKGFFSMSRNYIRIWNFDIERSEEKTIGLLESCKGLAEEFCRAQETIFQSCGIPSRFRAGFSSAFRKISPEALTDRAYNKTTISKVQDFFEEITKKRLESREQVFNIFEGADRVRFFRSANSTPKDIVMEISTIISSFRLPFFCYDFAKLKGRVKLTDFM